MSIPPGPPRVALIGVSGYGAVYHQLLREALADGAVSIGAAVIINQTEVPQIVTEFRSAGVRIYADTESFFASEAGRIDLCLIPVGIQWHTRLTIAALRAGMNVMVEKPLAGSLADVAAIRKAEAETGRWVAVGFQDIYAPETRWLKSRLLAGDIGRVQSIRMIGIWPRNRAYFTRNHWAGRLRADGADVLDSPLNNAFAHFANLSLYFAGTAQDESADIELESVELLRAHKIESFDTAAVHGVTAAGVRVWLGVTHSCPGLREPEIHIQGSAGRIEWHMESHCVFTDAEGRSQRYPLPTSDHARRLMLAAALGRLDAPETFICSTAIAEKHTRLIESVHQAGTILDIPSDSVAWIPDPRNDSELPSVKGLADRLDLAFRQGGSLYPDASTIRARLSSHAPHRMVT